MKSIKTLFVLLIALTVATTASAYNFTRDLQVGSRGEDVSKLQEMLISSGYLASDSMTGYFGSATELAVAKWQIANDIKPISGIFGAISRANAAQAPAANLSANTTNLSTPLTFEQIRWVADTLVNKRFVSRRNYAKLIDALRTPMITDEKLTLPVAGNYNFLSYNRLVNRDLSQERSTQPFMWKGLKLIVTDTMPVAVTGVNITESRVTSGELEFYLADDNNHKVGAVFPIFMTGFSAGQARFVKGLVSGSSYRCSSLSDCAFSTVPAGRYQLLMSDSVSQKTYFSDFFNLTGAELLSNTVTVGEVKYMSKLADDLDIDGCTVPITVGSPYSVCDLYQNGTAVSRNYGTSGTHTLNVGASYRMICNFTEGTPTRVEKSIPMCVRPVAATPVTPTPVVITPTPAPVPVVTPTKLSSAQLCAAIGMTAADSCSGYTSYSQRQNSPSFVYNGVTYSLSYTLNKNAAGARCNDLCSAVAK